MQRALVVLDDILSSSVGTVSPFSTNWAGFLFFFILYKYKTNNRPPAGMSYSKQTESGYLRQYRA